VPIGRQQKRSACTQSALSINRVERVVEEHYRTVEMGDALRLQTEQVILEQVADLRQAELVDGERLFEAPASASE
jgi:hypothetical protein